MTYRTRPGSVCRVMDNEESACWLAGELVTASIWFEVTPLPDCYWEVAVKKGDDFVLHRILTANLPQPGGREA